RRPLQRSSRRQADQEQAQPVRVSPRSRACQSRLWDRQRFGVPVSPLPASPLGSRRLHPALVGNAAALLITSSLPLTISLITLIARAVPTTCAPPATRFASDVQTARSTCPLFPERGGRSYRHTMSRSDVHTRASTLGPSLPASFRPVGTS